MVIHHWLRFADERRSVKCLGSAAGISFPSPPPPPPLLLLLLLFAQCPRALGLKGNGNDCYAGYLLFLFIFLSFMLSWLFFTLRSNLAPEMLVSLTFVWINLVVDNKNNIVSFSELLVDGCLLESFMLRELMFV